MQHVATMVCTKIHQSRAYVLADCLFRGSHYRTLCSKLSHPYAVAREALETSEPVLGVQITESELVAGDCNVVSLESSTNL